MRSTRRAVAGAASGSESVVVSGSDLMKPETLATEWLVSTKTLANLRSRGEGPPFVRVLGSIRYSRRACAEWLADQNRAAVRR